MTSRISESALAVIATAGNELQTLGAVVALEAGRHRFNVAWEEQERYDAGCIGPHLCIKRAKVGHPPGIINTFIATWM